MPNSNYHAQGGSESLLTVSTADIPVIHSAEVMHLEIPQVVISHLPGLARPNKHSKVSGR